MDLYLVKKSEGDADELMKNTLNDTENTLQIAPDLDSDINMRVCRVCLAINVKMYHMSEHELSVMFERVTGVEINAEDKLPKMLCWECVARLSSANRFREKSLKTQRILNTMTSSKFITVEDIKSIDRTHNQLKSTLGLKFYNSNYSNLHITEDSVDFGYKCNYTKEVRIDNIANEEDQNYASIDSEQIDISECSSMRVKNEVTHDYKDVGEVKIEICGNTNVNDVELLEISIKGENASQEVEDQLTSNQWSDSRGLKEIVKVEDVELIYNPQQSYEPLTHYGLTNYDDTCPTRIKNEIFLEDTHNYEEKANTECTEGQNHLNPRFAIINTYPNDAGSSKGFICNICNKSFDERTTLRQHMLRHTKPYNCSYCNFNTSNRFSLNTHINSKHTKKNAFVCDYCGYKTYIKKYLIAHIKTIHIKNISYDCSYCSFKTNQKSHLTTHINAIHTKKISFSCSICAYKTYRKNNLRKHVKAIHIKNISFDCSLCSYKTYRKHNLTEHVTIKHNKNITFDCSYCSYKAGRKSNLTRHVKVKHS